MIKKFGIIGNPLKHSLSPILHNYWFKKYNIDAEYSLYQIKETELSIIIKRIKKGELSGVNITLPFKQKIVSYLDRLVNDAETTSSVNTIFLDEQDRVVGENTDVFGLQAAYLKEVDQISKKKYISNRGGRCVPFSNFVFTKIWSKKYFYFKQNFRKMYFFKKKV